MRPKVSIVIPVYNAREYLDDRLSSLLSQSLGEIEIICVDDGSTDGSASIIERFAASDPRVRCVSQQNAGPAVARNCGLELVQGEYVAFFDCDDSCDRSLLRRVYEEAARADADVAIFAEKGVDHEDDFVFDLPWSMISNDFPKGVFSWRDNPDKILTSFQNWLHNKLFKVDFVRAHGLKLQELAHTEDMLFTCRALLEAERIVCVHGVYAYYRMGNLASQMNSAGLKHPLDFLTACTALHDYLVESGRMEEVRTSYQNWVADCVLVNSRIVSNLEADKLIYETLRDGGLERLELPGDPELYFDEKVPEKLGRFTECGYTEYLLAQLVELRSDHEKLVRAFEGVLSSKTYRLGDTIASAPRALIALLSRKK